MKRHREVVKKQGWPFVEGCKEHSQVIYFAWLVKQLCPDWPVEIPKFLITPLLVASCNTSAVIEAYGTIRGREVFFNCYYTPLFDLCGILLAKKSYLIFVYKTLGIEIVANEFLVGNATFYVASGASSKTYSIDSTTTLYDLLKTHQ